MLQAAFVYHRMIVRLQRFWRNWQSWNMTSLNQLSHVWEELELKEIQREEEDQADSGVVIAEPLQLLPHGQRMSFLKHAMRVRRAQILPLLELFQREVAFHESCLSMMSNSKSSAPPPLVEPVMKKPSLMSFAFTASVRKSTAEEGEILEWIRRARKNPDESAQRETARPNARQPKSMNSRQRRMTRREQQQQQESEGGPSAFGQLPDEEEMKRWGLTLESMPGLIDHREDGSPADGLVIF